MFCYLHGFIILNYIIDVENGDTLHLVERQPQPSPGSVTGEAVASNDNRGSSLLYCSYIFMLYNVFLGYCQMLFKNFYRFVLVSGQEHPTGGPRNRIGQITHSVVLGTLNVGEPGSGEAGVPDLSRVCWVVSLTILHMHDKQNYVHWYLCTF